MSVSVDFQKRLQDLIDEKGLKKTQIVKDMNIDYRSFSNAFNYGILPKPVVLLKIADFFHIPISYLLGQTDNDTFFPADTPSDFYSRYELLKTEKGVTSYKIAKDCHFDKSCISKWFSLKQLPSLEILELLADYFNVSLDFILGRSDDRWIHGYRK